MSDPNEVVVIRTRRGRAEFLKDMLYTKQKHWADEIDKLDTHIGVHLSAKGLYGEEVKAADAAHVAMSARQYELYRTLVNDFVNSLEETEEVL